MSALPETLAAAQARALAALEHAYLHELITVEEFGGRCSAIGCRDSALRAELLACLDVLRDYGVDPDAAAVSPPRLATESQREQIHAMLAELGEDPPELAGMTSTQAAHLLLALQTGTYDPEEWDIPF